MENRFIRVRGANVHNLKNMDIDIPKECLVVITGLSGSGKSSLAFSTIFAEGQRRYLESLSSYARQFLHQMDKPDVERIDGLSPAISIEQKSVSHNPRSTVGTVTEIHDYLRILYASVGIPYCYKCGCEITSQAVEQMVDSVINSGAAGDRFMILAPIVRGRKGEYRKELDELRKNGYVRVRVDGEMRELSEKIMLKRHHKHTIEVVVDRLVMKDGLAKRLADSIETALTLAGGLVIVSWIDGEELIFSEKLSCISCNISYPEIAPRMFSFNSPHGACPDCDGLGTRYDLDERLMIPDTGISLNEGAIKPWGGKRGAPYRKLLGFLAEEHDFNTDIPFKKLSQRARDIIMNGDGKGFEGLINNLRRRYRTSKSRLARNDIERFMAVRPCGGCGGSRIRRESLAIKVGERSIAELSGMQIGGLLEFFNAIKLGQMELEIAARILKEIRERLTFLLDVGLDYLTLSRTASTLSGGEAQRIRLATQIGSGLTGVLYILDEPSIGLHQRDNERLLKTLVKLKELGNSVLVVEHDEDIIRAADHIVDIGPGAGEHGGRLVAQGSLEDIINVSESLTGKYLRGDSLIGMPSSRPKRKNRGAIKIIGARENNLKNITVSLPLGKFTVVTGVSGSGKSSLVEQVLFRNIAGILRKSNMTGGAYDQFKGIEKIDKVINIDHTPIGRTPRSNPATYTGTFTHIRDLFAKLPESNIRGYKPGRYSFNVKGGRCEQCEGDGVIKVEMHFLPDVYVTCELCNGRRYNRETLEVRYRGKNIYDVLDLTIEKAIKFFENIPVIKNKLETLVDVGLGYIRLGQAATTLSGGEAQRVKLSKELAKRSTGSTLYVLDEPTTGLHFEDIQLLLTVLHRLVDAGNTVVVIEHNLDVVANADHLVDLGPEGGEKGGTIVATGSPVDIAKNSGSYTGIFLKKYFAQHQADLGSSTSP